MDEDGPYFVYHFMNGHEDGGRITVNYVQHGAFFTAPGAPPTLWRAVLDLGAGSVKRTQLDERKGEFPRDRSGTGWRRQPLWLAAGERQGRCPGSLWRARPL